MTHRTILLAGATLALSSCDTILGPTPPPGPMAPMGSATLTTATKPPFGSYVVDGSGRSVYVLIGTRGGSGINRCSGPCLSIWPPLPAPAMPTLGSGLSPAGLRAVSGFAGAQMSYSGWPLYHFRQDVGPGDTNGQGVQDSWGTWYLIRPSGEPLTPRY